MLKSTRQIFFRVMCAYALGHFANYLLEFFSSNMAWSVKFSSQGRECTRKCKTKFSIYKNKTVWLP